MNTPPDEIWTTRQAAFSWVLLFLLQGVLVLAALETIFLMRELSYSVNTLLRAVPEYVGIWGSLMILFQDRPILFFIVTIVLRLSHLVLHGKVAHGKLFRTWILIALMSLFEIIFYLSCLVIGTVFVVLNGVR